MSDIKEIAKRIIREEAACIGALENFIDDDFVRVVELILGIEGKVVFCGVGKSALIARKIVATLNSTGIPAVFMHAADAVHGDLGIIGSGDVVVCVSKSGNTPEIKSLVPLIKNLGNDRIVAMVSNTDSYLAKAAAYVLNVHVDKEADPNNLAPTNSTTAQLVMGDALAVALIECRRFSSRDFARFHPGGSLGKRLYVKVRDVSDGDNRPRVGRKDRIRDVIIAMSAGRLGAVAVVDGQDCLEGIITDGDLRRMLEKFRNIDELTAGDVMTVNPKTISPEELAYSAFGLMEKNSITQLVVVDGNGRYCGMVHLHDILKEGVV